MRIKLLLFFSIFTIATTVYLSAQFTEKRSKRGPSIGSLKESCCKIFGDVLQSSAQLFCSLGAVQKQALLIIEGYVDGDKESWCETASKQKLMTCKEKLSQLHAKIDEIVQECADTMRVITAT
jgi:hypothetical protein